MVCIMISVLCDLCFTYTHAYEEKKLEENKIEIQ